MSQFETKQKLKEDITFLDEGIKKSKEMVLKDDLVCMKRVMRRLEFTDKNNVPTLRGKVACSISAADELVVTEVLFSNMMS
jgi:ATP-dependent RNA helicase DOB1